MERRKVRFRPGSDRSSATATSPDVPSTSRTQGSTETSNGETEPYTFLAAVKKTYEDFSSDTTIHGFQYLRLQRKRREKILWIILMIIAFLQCAYLIRIQYLRWVNTPVILTFSEREFPVSKIPFPAVTFCTETKYARTEKIDFTKFFYYLKNNYDNNNKTVEPPPWMTEDEYLKMRALLQVCGNFVVKNLKFPEYPPMNFRDHLNDIVPEFDDNFLFCLFNDTKGDCNPLFEKIYTEEGICYTFNALNETEIYRENTYQYQYFEDDEHVRKRQKPLDWNITAGYFDVDDYDTYPERVIGSGVNSGLFVIMQGLKQHIDVICRGLVQGFKVILHSPDDVPQVEKGFFLVPYEQDLLIVVTPSFTYTTENVKNIDPEKRNCYYPEERFLQFFKFYTQNNCEIECMTNFTLGKCGCVQFSMPRLLDTRVCDAAQIDCMEEAENDFLLAEFTGISEERCHCIPGCWTVAYSVELSHGTFNMKKILESSDYKEIAQASRVTIYFKENEFRAWKRSQFISMTDFVAQCGGLFGVLMGATALNTIELIYFWTVRFFLNADRIQ